MYTDAWRKVEHAANIACKGRARIYNIHTLRGIIGTICGTMGIAAARVGVGRFAEGVLARDQKEVCFQKPTPLRHQSRTKYP